MLLDIIRYVRGYLQIRVSGSSVERFLNACSHRGIYLWGLRPVGQAYEMNITIKGFRQLKPVLRKTGTRVVIIKRTGLPFRTVMLSMTQSLSATRSIAFSVSSSFVPVEIESSFSFTCIYSFVPCIEADTHMMSPYSRRRSFTILPQSTCDFFMPLFISLELKYFNRISSV